MVKILINSVKDNGDNTLLLDVSITQFGILIRRVYYLIEVYHNLDMRWVSMIDMKTGVRSPVNKLLNRRSINEIKNRYKERYGEELKWRPQPKDMTK